MYHCTICHEIIHQWVPAKPVSAYHNIVTELYIKINICIWFVPFYNIWPSVTQSFCSSLPEFQPKKACKTVDFVILCLEKAPLWLQRWVVHHTPDIQVCHRHRFFFSFCNTLFSIVKRATSAFAFLDVTHHLHPFPTWVDH